MLALRKPTTRDVPQMQALIAPHVESEALLPRTRLDLVRGLRDYTLAERNGALIGLASVSLVDLHLAEVGAVVCQTTSDLGPLLDAVMAEARAMGVERVFVLAPDPAPYLEHGFVPTTLEHLPQKRDRQCLRCPRLPRCRQVPLMRSVLPN